MRTFRQLLLVIAAQLVTNATSFLVFSRNQETGVYPVSADSIGIPIIAMLGVSVLIFIMLAVALYVPKKSLAGAVAGFLLAIASAALSATVALSWATPHHYSIAIASCLVVAVSIWLACVFAIERRTVQSSEQTTPRQA